jgi:hypothetical protein
MLKIVEPKNRQHLFKFSHYLINSGDFSIICFCEDRRRIRMRPRATKITNIRFAPEVRHSVINNYLK